MMSLPLGPELASLHEYAGYVIKADKKREVELAHLLRGRPLGCNRFVTSTYSPRTCRAYWSFYWELRVKRLILLISSALGVWDLESLGGIIFLLASGRESRRITSTSIHDSDIIDILMVLGGWRDMGDIIDIAALTRNSCGVLLVKRSLFS